MNLRGRQFRFQNPIVWRGWLTTRRLDDLERRVMQLERPSTKPSAPPIDPSNRG